MNNKKILFVIVAFFTITVLFLIFVFFGRSEPPVLDHDNLKSPTIAQHVLTYTNDGVIALYSIKEEAKLDEIDLKTLSKKEASSDSEQIIQPNSESKQEQQKQQEQQEQTEGESVSCSCAETYKDFVKTEVIVKRGDSAWKIQKSLTPNRNIALMLKYVAEINGRIKLHPIYPGEKIIFLREMSDEDKPPLELEAKEEKHLIQKNNVVLPVPVSSYLYFDDINQKALFVYNNNTKTIYKVTVADNKLNVQEVGQNNEFVVAKGIYATTDFILLAENGTPNLQIYDIGNKAVRNIELQGILTNWVVQGDELYYTYGNRLGKFNLKNNEQRDVLLGDESIDMILLQDKLYILSAFGSQVENSLLMKVDPSELKVDDFIELKSNMISILSKGEDDKLYIGRIEREKDLTGEVKETPKITLINTKHLAMESNKWEMPYSDESAGYNSHLYMLKDGKLSIYPLNSTDPVQSIHVSGEAFMIVP